MGSCQSTSKNNVAEKKEDIKEYVDVSKKNEDVDKVITEVNKEEICKNNDEEKNEIKEEKEVDGEKKKIIIFNGAPGSGKDTQCRLIKQKYNFKILTSSELLKKYLEENKGKLTEDSDTNENKLSEQEKGDLEVVEKCINDGSLVPDEIVSRIFFQNLNYDINNVEFDGILINGFPRTYEQALSFKNNNIKVNALINMTTSKECLLDRINNRLVDPVTNINYDEKIIELIKKKRGGELTEEEEKIVSQNEDYNNLSDEDISRLIKRGDDEENVFHKRFSLYKDNEEKIISLFTDVCKNVDGEKSINEVFDEISSIIDNIVKS
ncbi:adenylate kinase 2, putative [Plasmodium gallinaceum]|uniref:Adenylate kinase 2, putative n=1 Tax=Plasmodium gallinaceum TaxID=5849 RepID=A0A1J1GLY2_PLAGA|nr:adenylate kinase 2, putative [Plasmodium gallinaceum]CRG93393.1 adenylate kinase 2, putative [Plasmodium gallinaceum]